MDFLLSPAKGLATSVTYNTYNVEQTNFFKDCTQMYKSDVPYESNIVASHVLYNITSLDDGKLMCKVIIAPHGNKDQDNNKVRRNSNACASNGIRLLLSFSSMSRCYLSKLDVKSAVLQCDPAIRDVYLIPPREC